MASDLTVVLARSTPTDKAVRDTLAGWSSADLLKDVVWVDVDEVDLDRPFAKLAAERISTSATPTRDLLGILAEEVRSAVRVVILETVGGAEAPSPDFLNGCKAVLDVVQPVLPVGVGSHGASYTSLETCRLVVPTAEASTTPLPTGRVSWTRTAVVSPEYRVSPDAIPEYVVAENLAPHAAAHVAAVGGLWRGMRQGVLDDRLAEATSTGFHTVIVLRTFARIVRTDGLAEALAREVVEVANARAELPFGVDTQTYVADDAELVTHARRCFSGSDKLSALEMDPSEEYVKRDVTFGEALRHVARFLGACAVQLVTVPAYYAFRLAEEGATAVTYGTEGTTRVRFLPADEDRLKRQAEKLLEEARTRVLASQGVRSRPHVSAEPELWRELRRLSFALVDGSYRPEWRFPGTADGRTAVVSRRRSVVLPPVPLGVPGEAARGLLQAELDRFDTEPTPQEYSGLLEESRPLVEARVRVLDGEPEPATGAGDEDSADSEGAGQDGPGAALVQECIEAIQSADDEAQLQAVLDDADRMKAYLEAMDPAAGVVSLHTELQQRVQTSVARARSEVEAAEVSLDPRPVAPQRVGRARLLFHLGSYLAMGAWVGWAVFELLQVTQGSSWAPLLENVVLRGLPGVALVVLLLALNYFRATSHYQREVEEELRRVLQSGPRLEHWRHEQSRLGSLETQLEEWSRIISRTIHQPYDGLEVSPRDGDESPDVTGALPAGVAIQVNRDLTPTRAQREELLAEELGRGWLSGAFHHLVEAAAADVEEAWPVLLDKADLDLPGAPNGARRVLLTSLDSGVPQHEATAGLVTRASRAVTDTSLPNDDSRPDALRMDAITGPPTAFVQYPYTSSGRVARSFEPGSSAVWAPATVSVAGEGIEEVQPIDRVVLHGRSYDMSIRCDVTDQLDPAHLHLFDAQFGRQSGSTGPRTPSTADPDEF